MKLSFSSFLGFFFDGIYSVLRSRIPKTTNKTKQKLSTHAKILQLNVPLSAVYPAIWSLCKLNDRYLNIVSSVKCTKLNKNEKKKLLFYLAEASNARNVVKANLNIYFLRFSSSSSTLSFGNWWAELSWAGLSFVFL